VSAENVEIVRRMLDAYFRGDFEAGLSAFAEDVEWRDQFGIYHGHEGVAESTARWAGTWDDLEMEVEELLDAGGDDVVLTIRQTGRGRGSGVPIEGTTSWVYTLRDSKIVLARLFGDPAEARKAAGLED
jgi:ketosteroid isomerase-like protein